MTRDHAIEIAIAKATTGVGGGGYGTRIGWFLAWLRRNGWKVVRA
jgi:hypothetical protein